MKGSELAKFRQLRTATCLFGLGFPASVRGWPQFMYSDPGSQLIGAEKESRNAWQNMDEDELRKKGVQNGMNWIFGPTDSPWYQGAVESLIKISKRAIIFAVGKRRLSVPEFLTVCTEVANFLMRGLSEPFRRQIPI